MPIKFMLAFCNTSYRKLHPLSSSPPRWLTTIRNFLHSTSTKIVLEQLWTPSPCRHNDRNIMDDAMKHLLTANLKAINNLCIHLQVCYLSEITDANGLVLLPEIRHMAATHSKLLWPYQPIPPQMHGNNGHGPSTCYTHDPTAIGYSNHSLRGSRQQ